MYCTCAIPVPIWIGTDACACPISVSPTPEPLPRPLIYRCGGSEHAQTFSSACQHSWCVFVFPISRSAIYMCSYSHAHRPRDPPPLAKKMALLQPKGKNSVLHSVTPQNATLGTAPSSQALTVPPSTNPLSSTDTAVDGMCDK